MNGMEQVIAVRQRRAKPEAVTVRLVREPQRHPFGLSWLDFGADSGHFTVEVLPGDGITGLDFRPLTGLFVTVEDEADSPSRHRKVAALVAAVEPETLVMPCRDADGTTLHIRRRGVTETHRFAS